MVATVRLSDHIERGAVGGPKFATVILTGSSGHEQRLSTWDDCRGEWDISYGVRKSKDGAPQDLATIIALHRACLGKAHPFLFKDHADFEADGEVIGAGDGTTALFQLIKTYVSRDDNDQIINSYVREITQPVLDTVTIYLDGIEVDDTDYTVTSGGLVAFLSAPAGPSPAEEITWSGEFYVPVRFDDDHLRVSMEFAGFGQVPAIRIVEVLDE